MYLFVLSSLLLALDVKMRKSRLATRSPVKSSASVLCANTSHHFYVLPSALKANASSKKTTPLFLRNLTLRSPSHPFKPITLARFILPTTTIHASSLVSVGMTVSNRSRTANSKGEEVRVKSHTTQALPPPPCKVCKALGRDTCDTSGSVRECEWYGKAGK